MSSLFAELKRRNVFKVGIAYVIVGWVVLQFIDVSAQILDLPKWFGKAVYILLIAGFPISLLLAWAYEITPQGLKKTKDVKATKSIATKTGQKLNYVIIAALALALGYFLWERQAGGPAGDAGGAREASIAVLPFADLSPGGDQGYFADGISEEILNVLAQIPTMKVAGRTSSFQFKGKNEDLRSIGQQLNVAHVLEGSVRKDNNRVRITVQLISADNGFHLWSETYDRELTDIFAVQDQISKAVADALQVQMGTAAGKQPETANLEAYTLYLRARQYLHARGTDNLLKAGKLFDAVVILDPNFSAAWSGMARAYGLYPAYSIETIDFQRYNALARHAAETAMKLDPKNAEAYSTLNYVQVADYQWAAAAASVQKAIELGPNDAEIANFIGDYYRVVGDFRNTQIWEERAYELDPLHDVNSVDLAQAYWDTGNFEQAVKYSRVAVERTPDQPNWYYIYVLSLSDLKRFDEADAALQQLKDSPAFDPFIWLQLTAYSEIAKGNVSQAKKHLEDMAAMAEAGTGTPSALFPLYLKLGDLENGAAWFEKAFAAHDPNIALPDTFIPETYSTDPAFLARFDLPGMKELFEIRRKNMAKNAAREE